MRDDFRSGVKEELAKRVGYRCSNLGCRQPTSGPQSDRSGAVNVGVAAHITAASEGGPRYDSALSSEERTAPENGIWLCQTCAKLIDSDVTKYSVEKLREWKRTAEETAARALERRVAPSEEFEGVLLEAEQLMPNLIQEMREDVRSDDTRLISEFVVLPSRGVVFWNEKPRFVYYESEHPQLQLQIDWLEQRGLVVDVTPKNAPVYRMAIGLLGWLREPV